MTAGLAPVPADGSLKVVFLGPPGSGKGTRRPFSPRGWEAPAISTGDMLREAVAARSPLGQRVQNIMAAGLLVDDDTMSEVVRDRLSRSPNGFLLDGYPRTLPQAVTLSSILAKLGGGPLTPVLLVDVPEEELVRRALARKREDDTEEVIRKRLWVYREQTVPLIGYYGGLGLLREIDGFPFGP